MISRRAMLLLPLGVAVGAGGAFLAMLRGMQTGRFDPRGITSPLIGQRVPAFSLDGLSDADLATGHPVLVNFFASWCEPCIEEAPVLMQLRERGTTLIGIAYKDKPRDTAAFLARHGNPYAKLSADSPGRVAIDFGVYGVPETYLVDAAGVVRWKYAGPMTAEIANRDLLPLLGRLA